ncbi:uncharacterized protein [Nicotiana tomentosiformis]|uniref:uncharacterized protein n=1 Tax=Nicotiana tomentosiformis TaxID=4098 RepID=UPI00388C3E8F
MVRRNGGIPKRGCSSKPKNYDLCHKCGKPGHFIKECPLLKQDQYKNNFDKAAKRNLVPDKRFKRKNVADNVETIENLKKEKDALDEKIAHIEHERDDLMVDVVDLKETFECVRKEKEILAERVANIEHERDDLLVMVVDLKETIREPKIESRPENSQKVKAIASKAHINLESELNSVKSSLCVELEKNNQLHEELGRVKSEE